MTRDEAIEHAKWLTAHAKEIDPAESMDWLDLTIGYLLAKGASPDEAAEHAIFIRYHTDYC